MKPLLSGPSVFKPGSINPVVLNGNKFSNDLEPCVTTQVVGFKPANCALSGLIAVPCANRSLQASTILTLQFPAASTAHPLAAPEKPGMGTSAGIVSWIGLISEVRRPS